MSLEVDNSDPDVQYYRIEGELDAFGVQQSRPVAEKAVERAVPLHILDASELSLIDSSGIGFVVYLFKKVKAAGGHFAIAGLNGQPQDMLRFLKLDQTVPSYPSVADVRETFERRRQL